MTKQEAIKTAEAVHVGVYSAIASAIGQVRKIGKTERNKFDGYDFASIDKFLELVNPICSENGLFPFVSQREVEFYDNINSKGGKSVWARFYFDITLNHKSGESIGPSNVMVAVPMNGAQASGSAQSYALKQFFRSTFMIPTGDKDDADLSATEPHAPPQTINANQFQKLQETADSAGVSEAQICNAAKIEHLHEMPADKFDSTMKKLNLTIEAKKAEAAKQIQDDGPNARNEDLAGDEIPY